MNNAYLNILFRFLTILAFIAGITISFVLITYGIVSGAHLPVDVKGKFICADVICVAWLIARFVEK